MEGGGKGVTRGPDAPDVWRDLTGLFANLYSFLGNGPKGDYPVEYKGNVCIFQSIYLFVCPQPANSCRSLDGWTNRQTNRLTGICIDFLCVMFYKTLPP